MHFLCPETQLPPTEMDQLDPLEADLVLCFRRWVLGLCKSDPRHWSVAWNDLAKLLGGKDARSAASGLNAMILEICGSARRHIRHHSPCCRYICGDELAVLSLIAACQRREVARARAVAGWCWKTVWTASFALRCVWRRPWPPRTASCRTGPCPPVPRPPMRRRKCKALGWCTKVRARVGGRRIDPPSRSARPGSPKTP